MVCYGTVVHVQTFSSKDNKLYSKLFVPVGYEMLSIVAEGDYTNLVGQPNIPFRLGLKDGIIKIYFDGKED